MPKLMVLYPYPADVEKFDRDYDEDHVPLVNTDTFPGLRKFVASKGVGTPAGTDPKYYVIAELHFDTTDDLQKSATSEGAQKAVEHAISISTGGEPVFIIAEEETRTFERAESA
ncbi:MAG TPA: EthD family reductase [Aridibacter sp.]|nr:EthD family reductase [Aridibacter sp.]